MIRLTPQVFKFPTEEEGELENVESKLDRQENSRPSPKSSGEGIDTKRLQQFNVGRSKSIQTGQEFKGIQKLTIFDRPQSYFKGPLELTVTVR
jgi:hypothetical protein